MPQGTADECIRERGVIAVVPPAGARQIPCRQGIFRENHCNALKTRNSIEPSREFLPLWQGIFRVGQGILRIEQGISGIFRKANYQISDLTQMDSNSASVNPGGPAIRSFDHLVGALEDRLRHCETERLRGLEVDDQRVFRWVLNGEIGRAGALDDAVDVGCRLRVHLD